MKTVYSNEKKPIKLWLDDMEDEALTQAKNLANLPFIHSHIAIMPDSHKGYGMPIGGVMATNGVVIPNAVGVDIGCGMCAVRTSLTDITREQLYQIIGGSAEYKGGIKSTIPRGRNSHSKKRDKLLMPKIDDSMTLFDMPIIKHEYEKARKQLGTLGGGNHFIEIQKGNDGYIWLMIHSGSRNLGYTVANTYNEIANDFNRRWYSEIPAKWELAFLPINSKYGQEYITAMNYCVEFAKNNRLDMMHHIFNNLLDIIPGTTFDTSLDVVHNYARMEHHFGKNVMVHRKGATSARAGETGIIPGSQGSPSYIVKGKGNIDSFDSCSHGAGRLMSRTKAKKKLNLEIEQKKMDDQGIIHDMYSVNRLDESPGSYKDIATVMANQSDLVDIMVELKPLAVIKG